MVKPAVKIPRMVYFWSKFSGVKIIMKVEPDWQDMINAVAEEFGLDARSVTLWGDEKYTRGRRLDPQLFRFSRSSWPFVLDFACLRLFDLEDTGFIHVEETPLQEDRIRQRLQYDAPQRITLDTPPSAQSEPTVVTPLINDQPLLASAFQERDTMRKGPVWICLRRLDEKTVWPVMAESTWKQVKNRVATMYGLEADRIQLWVYGQGRASENAPVGRYVQQGSHHGGTGRDGNPAIEIEALVDRVGAKPALSLYPANPRGVEVAICLGPDWSFANVHPPAPVTKVCEIGPGSITRDKVAWRVQAQPEGTLLENETGMQVPYLSWEAHANRNASGLDVGPTHLIKPSQTRLSPDQEHVVVVPVLDVVPCLNAALKELGLRAEVRTSLITYWVPSLIVHEHVAITFLSQKHCSRAATLWLNPKPDVLTRVFMIFQGVPVSELHRWDKVRVEKGESKFFWRDVAAVPSKERQSDASLFRVLEWGGMEIK